MPPSSPFFDPDTGAIDTERLLEEAIPLAKLVGLVGALALVPFLIAFTIGVFPVVLTIVTQFILTVGLGLVLVHVVARGVQLADAREADAQ